ncbi:SRPBCC domain-containing protein [Evansella sp. AB-P1]|uniref:SRPBCC family protein n=1 Tax=Evansella sp. AB-P1 TaxID=3037653 RepID=UPI00241CB268|nr:SRPBCC domain-containing protein [Evansella sp. AB-P1]MDG5787386.1 SRPBCC domain-containing protein [Evansella sp. AB-P1]
MENLTDIKHTVTLEAPIQKVWDTVSTAEGIGSWFMPNDIKPVVGHEFHLQSPFGPSPCKVLEVTEEKELSFSWDTDGWVVTFELQDLGEKTAFTLVHGGWKSADTVLPKANAKASEVRDRMDHGWIDIITELKKSVEA